MGQLTFQATLGGAVNLAGPNTATTTTFTLPAADGSSGQALQTNGSGTLSFAATSLTAGVSGILPIANGGTNSTATATAGGVGYGTGTAHAYTSAGSSGQVLTSNGSSAPTWSTPSGGSAATPIALGTVYGNTTTTGNSSFGYNAGLVVSGARNTFIGNKSGQNNTSGFENTAVGESSLLNVVTGGNNSAFGYAALQVNTASNNSAFGHGAAYANTTGDQNVAMGRLALYSNTTASNNTAIGYSATFSNQTGSNNTSVGHQALYSNTSGSENCVFGKDALKSNNAGDNCAFGWYALFSTTSGGGGRHCAFGSASIYNNTTGTKLTGFGYANLSNNTTGANNAALGYLALQNNTTGSGNTTINPLSSGGNYVPVFDPTTESNRFCMGSTAVTNAYIQVAWTVVSDARDKTDFAPVPHGLAFVTQLQPTAYRYKQTREATEGHGPIRYGFKAQDVLALEGSNPVIVDAEDSEKLRFNDQSMIAVLVKAIQELKAEFDLYKSTHS